MTNRSEEPKLDLKVIGVGYSKTGTLSLKTALQILGYKCYHGEDIVTTPGHAQIWLDYFTNAADSGAPPPFTELLAGYDAVLDFPHALYHRELRALCPDAAVILTERDAEMWVKSMMRDMGTGRRIVENWWILRYFFSEEIYKFCTFMVPVHDKGSMGNKTREEFLSSYKAHNALLKSDPGVTVMHPENGWRDLCAALKVDIPDVPYPHVNKKGSLVRGHLLRDMMKCVFFRYLCPLGAIIVAWYLM